MMNQMQFAIVKSKFNTEITQGLLTGAMSVLEEHGVPLNSVELFEAPGAFEIPLLAQALARTKKYNGIIALGCVIKGDTAHFEFISLGASVGIQQAMLETEVPISFGVLTTYTEEQAVERSGVSKDCLAHNKGREAALACLETALTLLRIRA